MFNRYSPTLPTLTFLHPNIYAFTRFNLIFVASESCLLENSLSSFYSFFVLTGCSKLYHCGWSSQLVTVHWARTSQTCLSIFFFFLISKYKHLPLFQGHRKFYCTAFISSPALYLHSAYCRSDNLLA